MSQSVPAQHLRGSRIGRRLGNGHGRVEHQRSPGQIAPELCQGAAHHVAALSSALQVGQHFGNVLLGPAPPLPVHDVLYGRCKGVSFLVEHVVVHRLEIPDGDGVAVIPAHLVDLPHEHVAGVAEHDGVAGVHTLVGDGADALHGLGPGLSGYVGGKERAAGLDGEIMAHACPLEAVQLHAHLVDGVLGGLFSRYAAKVFSCSVSVLAMARTASGCIFTFSPCAYASASFPF